MEGNGAARPRHRETSLAHRVQTPTGPVYRPVQYLGSKLRSLSPLTDSVGTHLEHGARVWDAFTGSTVVAQSLARTGVQVVASDELLSSVTFAQAMLGVGRGADDCTPDAVAASIIDLAKMAQDRDSHWQHWLDAEDRATQAVDGHALLNLGNEIPQRWRDPAQQSSKALRDLFSTVTEAATLNEVLYDGFMSTTYAGTYFGLRQSLRLEALRRAIHTQRTKNELSEWWANAALTALAGAASTAVYSAGKHFAQPHRVRPGKDLQFHATRCLSDRSVDIDREFSANLRSISASARPDSEAHLVHRMRVEDALTADAIQRMNIGVVYADPPYTAQQYSRFYHILEVLLSGIPADLQRRGSEVTRGLYPNNRYLSPFCSRVQAPSAFKNMATEIRKAGASLVISYSASLSGKTGNARTVSLDQLEAILTEAYGSDHVSVRPLRHRYRQFNRGDAGMPERDDPELLLEATL